MLVSVGGLGASAGSAAGLPGRWITADGWWVFPRSAGQLTGIYVEVDQYVPPVGPHDTTVQAWQGPCTRTDSTVDCSYVNAPAVAVRSFEYNALLTQVTLDARIDHRPLRIRWQSSTTQQSPDLQIEREFCSAHPFVGVADIALVQSKNVHGIAFRHVLRTSELRSAQVGQGVAAGAC